jgi:hypothetical protein
LRRSPPSKGGGAGCRFPYVLPEGGLTIPTWPETNSTLDCRLNGMGFISGLPQTERRSLATTPESGELDFSQGT